MPRRPNNYPIASNLHSKRPRFKVMHLPYFSCDISREDWNFFRKVEGVRFLGVPTSKCSNFTTTGSYSCRFHSRDNDDLYLTNLTQILKFHVDFRVIVEPAGWRHPIYQKVRNWFRSANKPLSSAKTFKNQQNKPL